MRPTDEQVEDIQAHLDFARVVAGRKNGGEMGVALANVMEVVLRWQSDPDIALLDVQDASRRVMDAIERGLQGG